MAGEPGSFATSETRFFELVEMLKTKAGTATLAELEHFFGSDGRELLRLMLQDTLTLGSIREPRLGSVVDAEGRGRPRAEPAHARSVETTLGVVVVERIAYRRPGEANLHPADAGLNLPKERFSHGLRQLAAVESSKGSFDDAVAAIEAGTGQRVGKRQAEQLCVRAAGDVEDFYAARSAPATDPGNVVVLSADGKGIIMRPEALRPKTAAAAEAATKKLSGRLSKGEKANRKRMAEVGTVYAVTPVARTPADILAKPGEERGVTPAPKARCKWLTAGVIENASGVIAKVFDEAQRRDPDHARTWVGLVDGNQAQIAAMKKQAKARGVDLQVLIDFIHVLEYLWKATWSFSDEGDPAAEVWVGKLALGVLAGKATIVAGIIRRRATREGLSKEKRAGADTCAKYLTNKAPYLDYPRALKEGWPIATGVIEGACRHLVKDRMDLTGARWGLEGAESVLKLRALRSNGDWDAYWQFHLEQEHRRVHLSRYANGVVPRAA